MPFWKHSEDPWDRKPPSLKPEKRKENPIGTLKDWNEARRARAKEKEEAKRLPPEKCPWCGAEMEQGFLTGGRDGVRWYSGIYRSGPLRCLDGTGRIDVLDEGGMWGGFYKTVWLCRKCRRAAFSMPEPYEPYAFHAEPDETKEEEESG